jgi:hypothetical protein
MPSSDGSHAILLAPKEKGLELMPAIQVQSWIGCVAVVLAAIVGVRLFDLRQHAELRQDRFASGKLACGLPIDKALRVESSL